MNGTWTPEGTVGMAAWTAYCHFPALRSDCDINNTPQSPIDHQYSPQVALVALHRRTRTQQVAQTLLAHIGNRHNINGRFAPPFVQHLQCANHRCHTYAIIANAWPMYNISMTFNFERRIEGKDSIRMSQQHEERPLASSPAPRIDITNLVKGRRIATLTQ